MSRCPECQDVSEPACDSWNWGKFAQVAATTFSKPAEGSSALGVGSHGSLRLLKLCHGTGCRVVGVSGTFKCLERTEHTMVKQHAGRVAKFTVHLSRCHSTAGEKLQRRRLSPQLMLVLQAFLVASRSSKPQVLQARRQTQLNEAPQSDPKCSRGSEGRTYTQKHR